MKKDGFELYVGKKSIWIQGEKLEHQTTLNVPQYPVETGAPMTDHAQIQEKTFSISGDLIDDNWNGVYQQMQTLQSWTDEYKVIGVRHGFWDTNYIISDFTPSMSVATNSIAVDMTLTKIRMPKSSYTKRKNSGKKAPAKKKSSAVWLTVRRGNTYWGWSMRYGTSIPQLRSWNHYPDRFIPIGVRVRVK